MAVTHNSNSNTATAPAAEAAGAAYAINTSAASATVAGFATVVVLAMTMLISSRFILILFERWGELSCTRPANQCKATSMSGTCFKPEIGTRLGSGFENNGIDGRVHDSSPRPSNEMRMSRNEFSMVIANTKAVTKPATAAEAASVA